MHTVWKFPLAFTKAGKYEGIVAMPRGARIVHFAIEYRGPLEGAPRQGVPTVWAEVDDQEAPAPRTFAIVGTGHALPDGAVHVGTYDAEPFVWHVYDMTQAITLPDTVANLPQEAINAYRLLRREGFTLQDALPGFAPTWAAPDDDPQTTEQMMALATLAEHGLGTLAGA